jgi:hypothetical protein
MNNDDETFYRIASIFFAIFIPVLYVFSQDIVMTHDAKKFMEIAPVPIVFFFAVHYASYRHTAIKKTDVTYREKSMMLEAFTAVCIRWVVIGGMLACAYYANEDTNNYQVFLANNNMREIYGGLFLTWTFHFRWSEDLFRGYCTGPAVLRDDDYRLRIFHTVKTLPGVWTLLKILLPFIYQQMDIAQLENPKRSLDDIRVAVLTACVVFVYRETVFTIANPFAWIVACPKAAYPIVMIAVLPSMQGLPWTKLSEIFSLVGLK